jgi:hypothetical protein
MSGTTPNDTARKTLGDDEILRATVESIIHSQPRSWSEIGHAKDAKERKRGFMQVVRVGVHTASAVIHVQTILASMERK